MRLRNYSTYNITKIPQRPSMPARDLKDIELSDSLTDINKHRDNRSFGI